MRGMRAPLIMEKHVGQREPRVSDKNTPRDLKSVVPAQEPQAEALDLKSLQYGSNTTQSIVGNVSVGVGMGPDIQFAGVSNGESLWALPNSQSPEASSDTMSLSSQFAGGSHMALGNTGIVNEDDPMADIDWEAFDVLFPPEQQMEPEMTELPFGVVRHY